MGFCGGDGLAPLVLEGSDELVEDADILTTLGKEKAVGKTRYCECSALARILGHLLGSSFVSRAGWLLVIMSGMWAMTKPSLKSSW